MNDGYDLIIVGGGNAGLAAAAAAGGHGLRTLILEKTDELGGQLHWSSGHFSAAGTRRQNARGIADHPDLHFDDVMRLGHHLNNPALVRLAVDNAAAAVDWLDDIGFPFAETTPALVTGHELYSRPRTYWGGNTSWGGGIPILESLLDQVEGLPGVTIRTGTAVADLVIRDAPIGNRAAGVVLDDGKEVFADDVILATGGYAASRELVRELQPRHAAALTGCRDHATGDGHEMLRHRGVPLTHTDTYVPTMGMIEDPARPGFGFHLFETRVIVDVQVRSPWEIWVNAEGRRFVAEDVASPFLREEALRTQPGMAMWVIWDRAAMQNAPPVIGREWTRDDLLAEAARGTWLRAYESIPALAEASGLPARALVRTVDDYNSSDPDPLGRSHRPLPDDELRPLDADGVPIRSLRAVGELLGMGQFSGDSFAGGMSVGPALALGRWAVDRIAAGRSR
jgi:fumarate reductase flavoprotein subunit